MIKYLLIFTLYHCPILTAAQLDSNSNDKIRDNFNNQTIKTTQANSGETILVADDRNLNNNFGTALSLNNNRALIGASGASSDDENGNSFGAAYVFEKIDNTWIQTAKLIADDGDEGDLFGTSVDLSGDTALVGSVFQQDVPNMGSIGAAYVFNLESNVWVQNAKLTADDGTPNNRFGEVVSLSGNRALISASADNNFTGAVYVYDLVEGIWVQSAKLTASDSAENNLFGRSISLLGDRALIGSNGDVAVTGDNTGAVYIFDLIDGVWTESEKLFANDGVSGNQFGRSVSLGIDRAMIGSIGLEEPDDNCDFQVRFGSVYVFDLEGDTWSQSAKILATFGCIFDGFGESISLSDDQAVIGAVFTGSNGINSGVAFLFDLIDGVWSKTNTIEASDGASNDRFGSSVSLFDGQFMISSPNKDDSSGTTYAYTVDLIFADGFE